MWEELIKATLLGTERTEISDNLRAYLEACNLPPAVSSEEELLTLLSIYAPMRKASVGDVKLELKKTIGIAAQQSFRGKFAKSLNAMLGGMYPDALPEFFNLLSQKNRTLPPSSLPDLFEKSLRNIAFWNQIKPVIGESGKWLLSQNSDWDVLCESQGETNWETGSKFERIKLLAQVRSSKMPEKAIGQLNSAWDREDWKTKVDFLKELKNGLSEKDEDFLENCLDEKRKEIRKAAAELLVKIPESWLSTAVYNYVENSFSLKNGTLKVAFPDEIDEQFAPLLDFSKKKTSLKIGLVANAFGQLFSKIPVEKWEKKYEREPSEVLKLFLRSDQKDLLVENLIYSLKEKHSEIWVANLLNLWVAGTHNLNFKEWKIEELIPAVSKETFNKIALLHIGENESLRGEHSVVLKFLQSSGQAWDDELTRRVLLPLKKHISELQGFDWSAWHYKEILKTAAYRISPGWGEHLSEGWNSVGSGWEMWQFEIEQFLGCLKFRAEMHKSFEEK